MSFLRLYQETARESRWLNEFDRRVPGGENSRNALLAVLFITLLYQYLTANRRDPREPKYIKHTVPVLGHLISIYKYGSRHFTWNAQKTGLPIYIIPVPGGGKIAIAHTPEVLGAIDRNPTAVAFIPLAARVIKKLSGLSREGDKILCDKLAGPNKHEGYMDILSKGVHSTLAPGPALDAVI